MPRGPRYTSYLLNCAVAILLAVAAPRLRALSLYAQQWMGTRAMTEWRHFVSDTPVGLKLHHPLVHLYSSTIEAYHEIVDVYFVSPAIALLPYLIILVVASRCVMNGAG